MTHCGFAAIIGALATMLTAIFQLVRNRAPEGAKPKKNRMRSLMATIALMIGCIVGGYAWSSLRAVSAKEELQTAMKAEFAEQFGRLVEARLGLADVAVRKRDPCEVLQRPRRAALVPRRAEAAERFRDETFGLREVAAEEIDHP